MPGIPRKNTQGKPGSPWPEAKLRPSARRRKAAAGQPARAGQAGAKIQAPDPEPSRTEAMNSPKTPGDRGGREE